MDPLDPSLLTMLVYGLSVVALVLVILCGILMRQVLHLRRQLRVSFPDGPGDVVDVLVGHASELSGLRTDIETVHSNTETLRGFMASMLSQVGVVRYDAFDDVGGAQSFSAALLDKRGNGIVISAINGRHETRCYGKQVVGGESEHTLSKEETEAIAAAMEGRLVRTLPRSRSRRMKAL